MAAIVADIATASSEQATGIEQVNKALAQMDEVTQQNSALVEENAATAKTLETQSATMTDQVSFFRLEESAAVIRLPASRSAPAAVQSGPEDVSAAPAKPAAKRGGIVGRTQAGLATALKQEPEWEEFWPGDSVEFPVKNIATVN